MNKEERINKLIEEALSSVNDIRRAEPKPFLLTRINARMNRGVESAWEKAGWFIGRPVVAYSGLCMLIIVNVIVVVSKQTSATVTTSEQVAQTPPDEFSYTVATIYDFENNQP